MIFKRVLEDDTYRVWLYNTIGEGLRTDPAFALRFLIEARDTVDGVPTKTVVQQKQHVTYIVEDGKPLPKELEPMFGEKPAIPEQSIPSGGRCGPRTATRRSRASDPAPFSKCREEPRSKSHKVCRPGQRRHRTRSSPVKSSRWPRGDAGAG
jgi:hypothetical protein